MPRSLLQTKLYFPPARPNLVPRPRLLERLQAGLKGPLTLVSAPAGSGKTTLMSEWRLGPGAKILAAWLSLDANDNDLLRFLAYLTAALESLQPGLTAKTRLLVESPEPLPTAVILTELVNEMDGFHTPFVLVLDDCHQVTDHAIYAALEFLLANCPSCMHLVLLTRSDPPLPLSRLRARGQMVEIRLEHLRFDMDEAAHYLTRVMRLDLTAEQVSALEARAEGWIVGLHMAALSMQGRTKESLADFVAEFTGSHRYIVDYLVSEVLENQSVASREFFLKTSILDRMSGPLCDAVTGQQDGQAVLQALEQANLFLVSLDDQRGWYRYHHLFADVLGKILKIELPDQVAELNRLAAEWLADQGLALEAIEHALSIPDYDLVRHVYRRFHPFLRSPENRAAVIRLFERLPRAYLQTEPWLCVVYAWMVWGAGNGQAAEELLDWSQSAYQDLLTRGKLPQGDPEYDTLPAEILAFRSLIHTTKNDPDRVVQLADQALALAQDRAPVISAIALLAQQVAYRQKGEMQKAIDSCLRALPLSRKADEIGTRVSVLHSLGVGLMIQGQLSQLIQAYAEGLQFAEAHTEIDHPRYDVIFFKLADVAYLRNELDRAESYLVQGFQRSERNNSLWPLFYGKSLQLQLRLARGDPKGALDLLAEFETLLERVRGAYFETEVVNFLVRNMLLVGKLDDVRIWAQSTKATFDLPLDSTEFEAAIQLAYAYEALGDLDQAVQHAEKLETITADLGCRHLQLYALIPQVMAWSKKGDTSNAQECLIRALALGETESYIRVFVDQGRIIQGLLKSACRTVQDMQLSLYIRRLLEAFEKPAEVESPIAQPFPAPLSERELEVLALIAGGCSNREIAQQLYIAIGTVKRHTVNIFNKLDVKSRTEAVAKARQSGIL